MIKTLLMVFILGIFCSSCITREVQVERAETIVQNPIYVKDVRTNLCFVVSRTTHGYEVLSNVPCTPEVLSLIGK